MCSVKGGGCVVWEVVGVWCWRWWVGDVRGGGRCER